MPSIERFATDPLVPLDMEIDSGEEAESQFFLSQQNLFPASVWDFSKQRPEKSKPRHAYNQRGEKQKNHEENSSKVRKKIRIEDENERMVHRDSIDFVDEVDEDEESLRLMLLAQVSRGKCKSKKQEDIARKDELKTEEDKTLISKTVDEKVTEREKDNGASVKTTEIKENIRPKSKPIKKSSKSANKAKLNSSLAKKSTSSVKPVPVSKIISRNNSSSSPANRREKKSRGKSKPMTISKADQEKFFPNLTKRIIIPLNADSDSDEDTVKSVPESQNVSSDMFGLDLEAFLKQARNSAKSTKNTSKPKYVKKKIALTPQLKAKALQLTLTDKKKLISAKISHLSRSKQQEYLRLKEILAKKEKVKKSNGIKKTVVDKQINGTLELREGNSLPKVNNVDEDESALRQSLLLNMKKGVGKKKDKSDKRIDSGRKGTLDKTSESDNLTIKSLASPQSKGGSLTVMLNGETRNVEVVEPSHSQVMPVNSHDVHPKLKEGVDTSKLTALKEFEVGVVDMRKTLSTSLFKLSAYMSQLQKETVGVENGLKYVEVLKRQLKETEDLVIKRQEKVDSLREVIKDSHQQITTQRNCMFEKEEECRSLGFEVYEDYQPPADGAENIKKKLEMIQRTAAKVKTTTYNGEVRLDSTGSSIKSGSVGGQVDYCSPLEHLNQAERLDGVKLDHNKELCRFELAGKCLDDMCQFQHCL